MRKIQYLGSFIVAFILGVFVMNDIGNFEVANSISNLNNKNKDYNQNIYDEIKDRELDNIKNGIFIGNVNSYWEYEYHYGHPLK